MCCLRRLRSQLCLPSPAEVYSELAVGVATRLLSVSGRGADAAGAYHPERADPTSPGCWYLEREIQEGIHAQRHLATAPTKHRDTKLPTEAGLNAALAAADGPGFARQLLLHHAFNGGLLFRNRPKERAEEVVRVLLAASCEPWELLVHLVEQQPWVEASDRRTSERLHSPDPAEGSAERTRQLAQALGGQAEELVAEGQGDVQALQNAVHVAGVPEVHQA
mmetsp:Transcript_70213/g.195411  ORF Transcript_70213/g.195411 Transcript_70213/m.195411 type:complete len:221 (-) Transcript_70213:206-868(-)